MNCEFCSSPIHVWFQCPKKPDGWRPARLAKESTAALMEVPVKQGGALTRTASRPMQATEPAGTQALPVDTNVALAGSPAPSGKVGAVRVGKETEVRSLDATAKFNKNAYMAVYMREVYRPRLKAKKEAARNA